MYIMLVRLHLTIAVATIAQRQLKGQKEINTSHYKTSLLELNMLPLMYQLEFLQNYAPY